METAKTTYQNIIDTKAKNIIIFVGDGMSLPSVTAARIYKAQKAVNFDGSVFGEESSLFFETLPHVALSKVCIFSVFAQWFLLRQFSSFSME